MSKLTVRTAQGEWLGLCDSEWRVLMDTGVWREIAPNQDMKVRHGSNSYWLDIECDRKVDYCPVDLDPSCWPGFTGNFDGGRVKGGGETGFVLCNCDDSVCVSYSGHTDQFNRAGGAFVVTSQREGIVHNTLPFTWFGGKAQVNEIALDCGSESGPILFDCLAYGIAAKDKNFRLRVYQNCQLLGDSWVNGNSFHVMYNAKEELGYVTVRVDAPENSVWSVRANAVNVEPYTTFVYPSPCLGTFGGKMRCTIEASDSFYYTNQAYEAVHYIGNEAGVMNIDYNVDVIPVTFRVFYAGVLLAEAKDVSGEGSFSFLFPYEAPVEHIVVRVETEPQNSDWTYSLYCPNQQGSRTNKLPLIPLEVSPFCTGERFPDNQINGSAPTTDLNVDFTGQPNGKVYVSFYAQSEIQILVYQNDVLYTGSKPIKGENYFTFWYDIERGTNVRIRIIGACCPVWRLSISTPIMEPHVHIEDDSVVRGPEGEIRHLCFPITLNRISDEPVIVEYSTSPITAVEGQGNYL